MHLEGPVCRRSGGVWSGLLVFGLFCLAKVGLCLDGGVGGGVLGRVGVEGTRFVLVESGEEVLLHGTAIENAGAPPNLTDAEIGVFVELGFNVLRVGFHWHLYEPVAGSWNESYLDAVSAFVSRVNAAGIWVVLDMHQDSLCPFTCGHGVPSWAAHPAENETAYWTNGSSAFPLPWVRPEFDRSDCVAGGKYCRVVDCGNVSAGPFSWATAYLTPFIGAGFQRLYAPTSAGGTRDLFAAFWERIARRFAANSGVLAFALLNEPWLGDVFHDPLLLVPGEADRVNLAPFWSALAQAVRSVSNDTQVWFEPATGGNILDATPIGLPSAPDPLSALSAHVYCPLIESDMPYRNASEAWEDLAICRVANAWQLQVRQGDAERLKVPWILSEFGAVDESNVTRAYLQFMTDQMDLQLGSWMYWLLTPSTDPNQPNWEAPILARTYARRVPGNALQQAFDANSSSYSLTFQPTTNATLEIYTSTTHHYPNGFQTQVSPPHALKQLAPRTKPAYTLLYFTPTTLNTPPANVTITITPRSKGK